MGVVDGQAARKAIVGVCVPRRVIRILRYQRSQTSAESKLRK